MLARIRTSTTVAAVAAAMVVCGAPAAYADDSLVCDLPVIHASGSVATVAAHWACASSDTGAIYWMTGTITTYGLYAGSYQMVGQADLTVRSLAGAASVNPSMSGSARPATWTYARFDGWAMGRHVVAKSPAYYVPGV